MGGKLCARIITVLTLLLLAGCYEVGGTVTGLQGAGLVLHNSNGETLSISADGPFKFNVPLRNSQTYRVSVAIQPSNPDQVCTVSSGSGGYVGGNTITNVSVVCASALASVRLSVSGLRSTGLVLQNNGADDLSVASSGSHFFTTQLPIGSSYEVSLVSQPNAPVQQECLLSNASGVVVAAGAEVTVNCRTLTGKYVYVVNSTSATITGLTVDSLGQLSAMPGSPFATPARPIALTVHASRRFIYLGHGISGTMSGFSVDAASGLLSTITGSPFQVATGGSVTSIAINPDGTIGYLSNGPDGQLFGVTIDTATGALTPIASGASIGRGVQPGVFSQDGKFFYSALTGGPATGSRPFGVVANSILPGGLLTEVVGSPFPTASLSPLLATLHPNGRYLYVTNQGLSTSPPSSIVNGSISVFVRNLLTGELSAVAGSPYTLPANLPAGAAVIHPNGRFLYVASHSRLGFPSSNVYSQGMVSAFVIDEATGALSEVSGSPFDTGALGSGGARLDPFNKYLFTANAGSGSMTSFAVDATTGALTSVPGSPFATGEAPGFAMDPSGLYLYVPQPVAGLLSTYYADPDSGQLSLRSTAPAGAAPSQARVFGLN